MIKLETFSLGEIEVEEEDIYYFPQGLLGFERYKRYVIIRPDESIPLSYLQSIEDGRVSFLVVNPFQFHSAYEFDISDQLKEDLHLNHSSEVSVCSVVSLGSSLEDTTVNLLAPIIMNSQNRQAKQIILHNSPYKTKHRLFSAASEAK